MSHFVPLWLPMLHPWPLADHLVSPPLSSTATFSIRLPIVFLGLNTLILSIGILVLILPLVSWYCAWFPNASLWRLAQLVKCSLFPRSTLILCYLLCSRTWFHISSDMIASLLTLPLATLTSIFFCSFTLGILLPSVIPPLLCLWQLPHGVTCHRFKDDQW